MEARPENIGEEILYQSRNELYLHLPYLDAALQTETAFDTKAKRG